MKRNHAEEWRLNQQFEMFDSILKETHGGDYEGMIDWVFSNHCINQFPTKFHHDTFISDFNKWQLDRKISSE